MTYDAKYSGPERREVTLENLHNELTLLQYVIKGNGSGGGVIQRVNRHSERIEAMEKVLLAIQSAQANCMNNKVHERLYDLERIATRLDTIWRVLRWLGPANVFFIAAVLLKMFGPL